jgi:hypothetical protein
VKAHARSWACRCGAHLMVTFDMVPGDQGDGRPKFSCPRCAAVHPVSLIPNVRILTDTVKVRRS